jgi:hypothetical protein
LTGLNPIIDYTCFFVSPEETSTPRSSSTSMLIGLPLSSWSYLPKMESLVWSSRVCGL